MGEAARQAAANPGVKISEVRCRVTGQKLAEVDSEGHIIIECRKCSSGKAGKQKHKITLSRLQGADGNTIRV